MLWSQGSVWLWIQKECSVGNSLSQSHQTLNKCLLILGLCYITSLQACEVPCQIGPFGLHPTQDITVVLSGPMTWSRWRDLGRSGSWSHYCPHWTSKWGWMGKQSCASSFSIQAEVWALRRKGREQGLSGKPWQGREQINPAHARQINLWQEKIYLQNKIKLNK